LLAVLVFVCFFSGDDEGLAFIIHAYAGCMVFMLVMFRAGLGVVGSKHSRFSDFAYSWAEIKSYGLSVLRLRPARYVGHNPLGGLMVFAMLIVLAITAMTGVFMVAAHFSWLEGVHEALGSIMQVLVALHITGVIVEQVLTGERLIKAMVTGSKETLGDQAHQVPALAPAWRSLLLSAVVIAVGVVIFGQINFGAAVVTFSAK